MLRFSDRLTSTPSLSMKPINASSDETAIKPPSPNDQEYTTLVELIGLYQTVKVLEAEYNLVTGRDGKTNKGLDIKTGTTPTHVMLIKRASELRDILGLSKCSSLLSRALEQQSTNTTLDHRTEEAQVRPQTPFTLRAEANEWTPPTGTESSRNTLKKVLHLGLNGNEANREMETKSLLPPFVEQSFRIVPIVQPGTYYTPTSVARSETRTDLTGDGKQFISSLSAKRDVPIAPPRQKPIAPPNKRPHPPPGLPLRATQQAHSFPLNASLLPQTFSVHLLSTLHMRFQHVSAALEMIDSVYSNEMSNTESIQPPAPARWETWMSPDGTAGMTRALLELRKGLDELCGATVRAGWIVDTWGAYQGGMLEGPKQNEQGLGSAAIDGVEIGGEGEMQQGIQAPIGRPTGEKKHATSQLDTTPIAVTKTCRIVAGKAVNTSPVIGETLITNVVGNTPQIQKTKKNDTPSYGKATIVPAVPVRNFRPPPGLPFRLSSPGSPNNSAMMNGSKRFPPTPVSEAGKGLMETSTEILQKGRLSLDDQLELLKRTQQVSAGMAAT